MKEENRYIDLGDRGKLSKNNKLNELTGKEWIKFTKSWFIHRPPKREEDVILHPAKYPESLVAEFINFFTKSGQWVLDPFAGTGSTLVAAGECGRNAVGIELNKKYYNIVRQRLEKFNSVKLNIINGNSINLIDLLSRSELRDIKFDYCITSPPYWNQLKRNSIRQKERDESGLDTVYSDSAEDLGNVEEYNSFLEMQAMIFDQVYDVMKEDGYLTIITNNVYFEGKLYPLAFDTAISLTKRGEKSWVLKDEKIWLQDDKPLVALGVNSAWVGNRHHQYCLIFRKEKK